MNLINAILLSFACLKDTYFKWWKQNRSVFKIPIYKMHGYEKRADFDDTLYFVRSNGW